LDYSNGIYKTYRITIYFESDQGPLHLGHAISSMMETNNSIIANRILNIEAEQQVLLDDGTYVNTECELGRIENKNRSSKIQLFQREYSTSNQPNPNTISRSQSPAHRTDPDLLFASDILFEPVSESKDLSPASNELRRIVKEDIKQTSMLEYLG
jgi:hypothetical protein